MAEGIIMIREEEVSQMLRIINKRVFRGVSSGQGTIETLVVFILVFILFFGIIKMWNWGNDQLVYRAGQYQSSRKKAGQGEDRWPLNKYHKVGSVFGYTPPDISGLNGNGQ